MGIEVKLAFYKTITGLNSANSYGNIGDELVVPYGITAINANAFGTTKKSNLAKALSGVDTLYIPRTLKTSGNNAFSGLSCLQYLVVEPGTNLTSIA